jgi:hypothetical protein
MTAIHGFRDYYPVPVKEKAAAIPPPPDEIRPEPVPSMISVFEYDPRAFDDEPRRPWWVRLARLWRR